MGRSGKRHWDPSTLFPFVSEASLEQGFTRSSCLYAEGMPRHSFARQCIREGSPFTPRMPFLSFPLALLTLPGLRMLKVCAKHYKLVLNSKFFEEFPLTPLTASKRAPHLALHSAPYWVGRSLAFPPILIDNRKKSLKRYFVLILFFRCIKQVMHCQAC